MDAYADGTPMVPNNVASWYSFAQRPFEQGGLGLAPHQAAGVVGNLLQESGGGIPSWGPTGDNGTAWGSAQWRNERLNGLRQFAQANGMDFKSTEAQQAWMRHELTTSHAHAYDALRSAQSPEDAANAFNKLYEISADTSGRRAANARALLQGGPDALAALNRAAGTPATPGTGALSFAEGDGGDTGALDSSNALGSGALQQLMSGDKPDKMNTIGSGLMQAGAALAGISSPSQASTLNSAAAAMRKDGQSNYKMLMGADGTLYRMDDSGNVSAVKTASTRQKQFLPAKMKDANGNEVAGAFNPQTGEYTWANGGGAAQPEFPATLDELKQKDPTLYNQVVGVNEGRIPYPNASRLNPQQQRLKNAVSNYFPDVDATTFSGRQAFMKNLGTDQPSQPGGQFVSLGHVLDMANQVAKQYQGLHNSDIGYGIGEAMNPTRDSFLGSYRMSNERASKLDALNSTTHQLANEMGRLFSGNQGGGVHEREEVRGRFGGEKTPTAAATNLAAVRDMILSRRDNLLDQARVLGIPPARIPGMDKVEQTIGELNDNIDALKGLKPAAGAPAAGGKRPSLTDIFGQ